MAASAFNPPVNAMQFPSLTAALATANPVTLEGFSVLGFTQAGDRGDGIWKKIAAPTTNTYGSIVPPGIERQDAAGNWFQYVPGDQGVVANAIGPLVQDAVVNGLGQVVGTPADDLPVLQAAVDAALYVYRTNCSIKRGGGTGISFISATLQVGYGLIFCGGTLEFLGDTYMFDGHPRNGNSALVMSRSDCPMINVQGGRGTTIRCPTLLGPMQAYIVRNGLGTAQVHAGIDDTILANWIDPAQSPTANSRYAPNAGITVDAVSGAAPATAYPASAFVYPQWYANRANDGVPIPQYGKSFSSNVHIERPCIMGVVVPVAVQPCDADGNGDFVSVTDGECTYCVYGLLSVGNTQSRNVNVANMALSNFHTAITNMGHGKRNGHIGGPVSNCAFGNYIQAFHGGGTAGPVTFSQCYGEGAWMLATVVGYFQLTLINCLFDFAGQQTAARGVPLAVMPNSGQGRIRIMGCKLVNCHSVLTLGGAAQAYEFTDNQVGIHLIPPASPYQYLAFNFTAGGVMFTPTGVLPAPGGFSVLHVEGADCRAARPTGPKMVNSINPVSRAFPQCAWVPMAQPYGQPGYTVPTPQVWTGVAASSFGAVSLNGTSLTMSCPAQFTDNEMKLIGMVPGCVFVTSDGTVFFIHSNTGPGGQILAEQQNNFRGGSGSCGSGPGARPIAPINLTSGAFTFGNALLFLPTFFTQGSLSTSSPTVTATGRADGYSAYLNTDLTVGDLAYVNNQVDFWLGLGNLNITAIAPGGGSITFAGDPNYAQANKPLTWFIAAPPANQAKA